MLGLALQLLVVYGPALPGWFHTVALSPRDLIVALLGSVGVFAVIEIRKLVTRRSHAN